ncbi:hypothetical protein UFOVP724_111 [uncultured Caudovirales phage]|uniref:Uncharacterized protein n=1 Tax=uncultured Caudovirales phage TaxID=2100421 RepID=A0A6J5NLF9_9CAUD|nr:hypothetical protein UFOVP724_111 [uncultured Caudovirales phage]
MSTLKGKQILANSVNVDRLQSDGVDKLLVGSANTDAPVFKTVTGNVTFATSGANLVSSIATGAVDGDKIASSAVTSTHLANGSVITSKIADANVTTGKIAGNAITNALIADAAISGAKITDASLPQAKLEAAAQSATISQANDAKLALVSAVRAYVDEKFETAVQGLDFKAAVKTASTTNVTIASPGAAINGHSLVNGDRVLLKAQTDATQNGIYVFDTTTTAMTRAADADDSPDGEVTGGLLVYVEQGNLAGTSWVMTSPAGGVVIGTDELTFVQFSSGAAMSGGEGIAISGTTISLALSELNAESSLELTDKFAFVDASDSSSNKVVTLENLATAMAGTGISASGGQLSVTATGAVLSADKLGFNVSAAKAGANNLSTGIQLGATAKGPAILFVNGLEQRHGSAYDYYFSPDGTTVRNNTGDVVATDTLYWNATQAGFGLETTDFLSLVFEV